MAIKRQLVELALLTAGAVFLAKAGWSAYQFWRFQNQPLPAQMVQTLISNEKQELPSFHPVILGRLSISRLHMSALVVEGDDEQSLSVAVGHMKGTASFGRRGNTVVSGHRDTAFWPLQKIKIGDSIVISTNKTYVYTVEQTQIVDPENTSVLQDSQGSLLTVITCYPFRHVGPSPKRFVVTARLLPTQYR